MLNLYDLVQMGIESSARVGVTNNFQFANGLLPKSISCRSKDRLLGSPQLIEAIIVQPCAAYIYVYNYIYIYPCFVAVVPVFACCLYLSLSSELKPVSSCFPGALEARSAWAVYEAEAKASLVRPCY